jgi:hypothetical protein
MSSTPRLRQAKTRVEGPGQGVQQGLVERPYRQYVGHRGHRSGVDRQIGAGDEHQGEQDELDDRGRGLGVADQGGHRHAEGAEAGRAQHERHHDRGPPRESGERHPVQPPDADDQQHVHHAQHGAVRQQPEEVRPGGQGCGPYPFEDPVLPPGGEHDGQLAVAGAQDGDRRDRGHVVAQRREPVEVRVGAPPPNIEPKTAMTTTGKTKVKKALCGLRQKDSCS